MRVNFLAAALVALLAISGCNRNSDNDSELSADASAGGAFSGLPSDNAASVPTQPVFQEPITPNPGFGIGTQEQLRAEIGDRIFFETNGTAIDPRAQPILQSLVGWLNQHPQRSLRIEGHADERGTREFNLALGNSRATAVKNYMTAAGVNPARLTTISYGKERPAAAGSAPAAWSQNRRAVFIVF